MSCQPLLLTVFHPTAYFLQRRLDNKLRIAAKAGDASGVERLLSEGADPNATFTFNHTALHVAVQEGHYQSARALLDGGAAVTPEKFGTGINALVCSGCVSDSIAASGQSAFSTKPFPAHCARDCRLLIRTNAAALGLPIGQPQVGPAVVPAWR